MTQKDSVARHREAVVMLEQESARVREEGVYGLGEPPLGIDHARVGSRFTLEVIATVDGFEYAEVVEVAEVIAEWTRPT